MEESLYQDSMQGIWILSSGATNYFSLDTTCDITFFKKKKSKGDLAGEVGERIHFTIQAACCGLVRDYAGRVIRDFYCNLGVYLDIKAEL